MFDKCNWRVMENKVEALSKQLVKHSTKILFMKGIFNK